MIYTRFLPQPARKELSDGRNAHLIIKDKDWWIEVLQRNIQGTIVYNELNKKGKLDFSTLLLPLFV